MRHVCARVFSAARNAGKFRHLSTSNCRPKESTYDAPGKTTATVLNLINKDTILIEECDERGFVLNNNSMVVGPIAAFPRTVLSWNICTAKDINEASLSLFLALEPKIELLVIGMERNYDLAEITRIKNLLRRASIPSEILPTKHAVSVFNFASCEGRYVAAGLIPPVEQEEAKSVNKEITPT